MFTHWVVKVLFFTSGGSKVIGRGVVTFLPSSPIIETTADADAAGIGAA